MKMGYLNISGKENQGQFIRFLFVGVLNTLFGYFCYAFFLWVGLHYGAASLLATIAGVAFNYKSTGTLVFGAQGYSRVLRFVSVYAFLYLMNLGLLYFMDRAGISSYVSGAITLVPMALLSFVLMKTVVFAHEKAD